MNSISWLVYLADISQGISTLLGFSAFVLAMFLGVLTAGVFIKGWAWPKTRYYFLVGFLAFSAAIIPSKNAIYMIAASEMGERAINTELAGDVFFIIKKEIQKMKEKHQ